MKKILDPSLKFYLTLCYCRSYIGYFGCICLHIPCVTVPCAMDQVCSLNSFQKAITDMGTQQRECNEMNTLLFTRKEKAVSWKTCKGKETNEVDSSQLHVQASLLTSFHCRTIRPFLHRPQSLVILTSYKFWMSVARLDSPFPLWSSCFFPASSASMFPSFLYRETNRSRLLQLENREFQKHHSMSLLTSVSQ